MSENNIITPDEFEKEPRIVNWTDDHVNILVDWADKAMCYRWLHSKSYEKYNRLNTWFTIPVIIMSTLTGTANFAQERVPPDMRGHFSMIVGGVNILAGIITTIQNFLKIGELNESHRIGSISWDKFYRKIRVELAKSPDERQNVEVFLKHCTEEFDRLMETSPDIEEKIVKLFKTTFEGIPQYDTSGNLILTEQQKAFKDLKKPEICDSLESVKKSIYSKSLMSTKLLSTEASNSIAEIVKKKQMIDSKQKKIDEFTSKFVEQYNRQPTEEEIVENLENEQEKVTKELVGNMVNRFKRNKASINQKLSVVNPLGDENV